MHIYVYKYFNNSMLLWRFMSDMKVVKEKIHNAGYVVQYKRESISCFVPCSNLTKQCRITHQEITDIIFHHYDEIILHVYISL